MGNNTAGRTVAQIVSLLERGFGLMLEKTGGGVEVTVHDFGSHSHHQGETLYEALGKAAAAYRSRSGCEACDTERRKPGKKLSEELHSCDPRPPQPAKEE